MNEVPPLYDTENNQEFVDAGCTVNLDTAAASPAPDVITEEQKQEVETEPTVPQSLYDQMHEKFLYKCAEFDNYIKRENKRKTEAERLKDKDLLNALIPALNNLYHAANAANNPTSPETMLLRSFVNALKGRNIEIATPIVNEVFNGDEMSAVNTVGTDNPDMDNKVSSVFSPGYKIDGTFIRYPEVSVFKLEEA